jgi:hypothetical protein
MTTLRPPQIKMCCSEAGTKISLLGGNSISKLYHPRKQALAAPSRGGAALQGWRSGSLKLFDGPSGQETIWPLNEALLILLRRCPET